MANQLARRLRKNLTVDERKLWSVLRDLRSQGFHFRRQAPFGSYILDFVCFSARLAIEVDGVQHDLPAARRRDAARDAFLSAQGFKVLRFRNGEVSETLDGVVLEILHELGKLERPPDSYLDWSPPPLTPPHEGEGNPTPLFPLRKAERQA